MEIERRVHGQGGKAHTGLSVGRQRGGGQGSEGGYGVLPPDFCWGGGSPLRGGVNRSGLDTEGERIPV